MFEFTVVSPKAVMYVGVQRIVSSIRCANIVSTRLPNKAGDIPAVGGQGFMSVAKNRK